MVRIDLGLAININILNMMMATEIPKQNLWLNQFIKKLSSSQAELNISVF